MGNPCRSAVEGNALNCGLMLTCGAAHRVAVNDGLASFTISCCQKMLKRAPEGMRFNPSGLRRTDRRGTCPTGSFQCWVTSRCGRGPRAYMQPKAALKPGHLAVGWPGLAIVIFLPIIVVSLRMRPACGRASPGFTGLANASPLASLHHCRLRRVR